MITRSRLQENYCYLDSAVCEVRGRKKPPWHLFSGFGPRKQASRWGRPVVRRLATAAALQ